MRSFKDRNGRDWALEVDVLARRKVRLATGGQVDLFGAIDGSLQKALAEPDHLFDTLWALCEEQATASAIERTQFEKALHGAEIDAASLALMEAVSDFFAPGQREILRKALANSRAIKTQVQQVMSKALDVDLTKLNVSSTNTPATSESAPTV